MYIVMRAVSQCTVAFVMSRIRNMAFVMSGVRNTTFVMSAVQKRFLLCQNFLPYMASVRYLFEQGASGNGKCSFLVFSKNNGFVMSGVRITTFVMSEIVD